MRNKFEVGEIVTLTEQPAHWYTRQAVVIQTATRDSDFVLLQVESALKPGTFYYYRARPAQISARVGE